MECSGTIADAFARYGHDAISCDLKVGHNKLSRHIRGDVFDTLAMLRGWADLAILHPVCRFLSVSGYHWCYRDPAKYPKTICGPERLAEVEKAVADYMKCVEVGKRFGIPRVAVENPIGIMSTRYRKPDQKFQPYDFGDDASKLTGLHLENLPPLWPTMRVPGRIVECDGKTVERWSNQTDSGQNNLGPTEDPEDRRAERATTYPGPADAMARQWGVL